MHLTNTITGRKIALSLCFTQFFRKRQKQPLEVFYKKVLLRNLASIKGKYLCCNLFFNKMQPESGNFIKKRDSGTGEFPTNFEFCEFLKNNFFAEQL